MLGSDELFLLASDRSGGGVIGGISGWSVWSVGAGMGWWGSLVGVACVLALPLGPDPIICLYCCDTSVIVCSGAGVSRWCWPITGDLGRWWWVISVLSREVDGLDSVGGGWG